jgi:hypothetical protein
MATRGRLSRQNLAGANLVHSDMDHATPMSNRISWKRKLLFALAGCASVGALLVVVGLAVAMWATSVVDDLGPPTPVAIAVSVAVAAEVSPAIDIALGPARPGPRLEIDLADGRFEVVAGEPGSEVQVNGACASHYYELVEEHSAADGADGPVTAIRLRPTSSSLVRMMAAFRGGRPDTEVNRLTVSIPPDRALALVLRVKQGESRIDLGGLTLTDLDAELSRGDHRLGFGTPLAQPVPQIRVDSRMGNVELAGLGNARARLLSASSRMGNFSVDLSGVWRDGEVSELDLEHSMGDLRLSVRTAVRLSADSVSSATFGEGGQIDRRGETSDTDAPALRLRVSTTMGSTRITRYDTAESDGVATWLPAPAAGAIVR